MITLNKIKKIYGSGQNCVIALDDISLHIDEGDFVAILENPDLENPPYYTY